MMTTVTADRVYSVVLECDGEEKLLQVDTGAAALATAE